MKTFQNKNIISSKNSQAFTLVELIVVIVILAILSTIAFLSFSSYSSSSRDSSRMADISNLSKGLELHKTKSGYYPFPEGLISTGTVSGVQVMYKGIIGEKLSKIVNISKIPVDPLDNATQYSYGITYDKNNFQIAGILENGQQLGYNLIEKAFASNEQAIVQGNYNGYLKFSTGSNYFLINMPSLIYNFSGAINDVLNDKNNVYFVVNKNNNIPYIIGDISSINNKNTDLLIQELADNNNSTLTGVNITSIVTTSDSIKRSQEIEKIFGTGSTPESKALIDSFRIISNLSDPIKTIYTIDKVINLKVGGNENIEEDNNIITYLNIDGSSTPYLSDIASGSGRFELYDGSLSLSGVTYDKITGLFWQSIGGNNELVSCKTFDTNSFSDTTCNDGIASDDCNWCAAKNYCANLSLGGFDDWRLPDITEFLSIVDFSKIAGTKIDSIYFAGGNVEYWTSNNNPGTLSTAYKISGYNGSFGATLKYNSLYLRCVR
ncbi:MAG: DUF1566 domain-containing protein [Candidatus Gracilibacteria bacterium]|nr:DUF1566 domain-containing protein [Candidatus Gracilibacteria bacterium]MDD2908427.1 DUF1566 domain-containing protein [Candidatus Gracilibacteria bacterium]